MAQTAAAPTERDAASVQEARTLVQRARLAAPILAEFSQEQIDRIVDAVAAKANVSISLHMIRAEQEMTKALVDILV